MKCRLPPTREQESYVKQGEEPANVPPLHVCVIRRSFHPEKGGMSGLAQPLPPAQSWNPRERAKVGINNARDKTEGCSVHFPKPIFHQREGSSLPLEKVNDQRGRKGIKPSTA